MLVDGKVVDNNSLVTITKKKVEESGELDNGGAIKAFSVSASSVDLESMTKERVISLC